MCSFGLALAAVFITTPALAASLAETMANRSGAVIGAAAGCGVPEERLLAVSKTAIGMIEAASASRRETERARRIFERAIARVAVNMRRHQAECPEAIADFERAEQN